jgi:hypothetical protein
MTKRFCFDFKNASRCGTTHAMKNLNWMRCGWVAMFLASGAAHAANKILGPFEFTNSHMLGWVIVDETNKKKVGQQCAYHGACWDLYRGSIYYQLKTRSDAVAAELDAIPDGQEIRVRYDKLEYDGTFYQDPVYKVNVIEVNP